MSSNISSNRMGGEKNDIKERNLAKDKKEKYVIIQESKEWTSMSKLKVPDQECSPAHPG